MEEKQAQAARPDMQLGRILELVTKQMAVAVSLCSRDFRYLWANQEYANWLQLPLDKIVGHPIADVLGMDAFNALRQHFERVLTGETVYYERETKFRGIGQRWTSATYTPTSDSHSVANGWVTVVVDITERKRAEESLRQKERELLEAQRLAEVGSWHWDVRNDVVTWSEELYRIAGLDPKLPAPSYKEIPQFYTPESWERLQRAVEKALRTGTPYELDLEIIRPDGTTRWIRTRGEVVGDTTGRHRRVTWHGSRHHRAQTGGRGPRRHEPKAA